ncbi:MAG: 30S ribosome-binding factor RbfA [Gammaproteobacteria bacterium]|jgi:ribosome-binding factor A|nr:ribosome-binding factor A [Gammaproteobacteria bacterium]|tara:strand:- start:2637 stop:2951 length:315 start_codon:yes stop_codon:yes gene_type:complete
MRSEDFSRADRLSDLLRSEISLILRDEVKDPRLEGLTIIKVDLSKDIKKAYVFFSTLNSFNDKEFSEIEDGLQKAKGFIRSALGRRIKIKRLPELSFERDTLNQ